MRVIFMGTPDFAVPSLRALLDRGDQILAVFTQPDRPKGRGHRLQAPPVKELALESGLQVYQPTTLRDGQIQELIRDLAPEAVVVAAYGKLLPKEVLDIPPLGCVNVHASLLPKYRGAAPIQWAVIRGEKVTGVTTMRMAEGMDTGDILLRERTPIGPEETAGELFDRLKVLGASLLGETLDRLEAGELVPIPQREEEATRAPMLTKELSVLDWTRPAQELHDLIRGLDPWPRAEARLDGRRLKLLASRVEPAVAGDPGQALCRDGELLAACGQGALRLTEVLGENGKRMSGREYLLGHPLGEGARFE